MATGTFLGGKSFRGDVVASEGRFGEPPATELSRALRRLGFPTRRLKTGTPPRVDRSTIDASAMLEQAPSAAPLMFSYRSQARFAGPQLACYITETNARTHALVRDNLSKSPLYGLDLIRGVGPRYCPSIEDKVIKFAAQSQPSDLHRARRLGRTNVVRRGFSTSLPAEIQLEMLRSMRGAGKLHDVARGIRCGVRRGSRPSNSMRRWKRGGSPAYITAANSTERRATKKRPPRDLWRASMPAGPRSASRPCAYRAVKRTSAFLIDDLITKDVDEPYRMLTSRAEHRVVLRHDNADLRLTPVGRDAGLIDDAAWDAFCSRRNALNEGLRAAERLRYQAIERLPAGITIAGALRRPEIEYADVLNAFEPPLDNEIGERVALEIKIAGYVRGKNWRSKKPPKPSRSRFHLPSTTIPSRHCRAKRAKSSRAVALRPSARPEESRASRRPTLPSSASSCRVAARPER